ncbi:MAG: DUF2007 domain-containing protein [Tannerellaceae bacterium]|jgi:hypothetical protein|nr:DUF2007 domain-containing protein [Tannerellaceae bacterium]
METTDKMVEIARFQYPAEAQTLMALLQSEGIDCYLRNEYTSQVMAGYVDTGGARVEILESNIARALEVMEAGGYEIPGEEEEAGQYQDVAGWARQVPFLRKLPLEKQILVLFILVAVCLGLFIYFGSLFTAVP